MRKVVLLGTMMAVILAMAAGAALAAHNNITGTNSGDDLIGTNRVDRIYGLGGNDFISARGGNDDVFPGTGRDTVRTNGGNDYINAADEDNADTINCGAGLNDTVVFDDGIDTVNDNCENQQPVDPSENDVDDDMDEEEVMEALAN
jgi:Ca2+-binding RTX toxin-like protein